MSEVEYMYTVIDSLFSNSISSVSGIINAIQIDGVAELLKPHHAEGARLIANAMNDIADMLEAKEAFMNSITNTIDGSQSLDDAKKLLDSIEGVPQEVKDSILSCMSVIREHSS